MVVPRHSATSGPGAVVGVVTPPTAVLPTAVLPTAVLPMAALPPEAVVSLRRAFRREVRVRVPRLLDAARQSDVVTAVQRADAVMLLEGCRLLGDAAAARALEALLLLLDGDPRPARIEAADMVALLLGRWSAPTADD